MTLNWFLSRAVREANHMQKHVWKLLCAQRDVLAPQAIEAVSAAVADTRAACRDRRDRTRLEASVQSLQNTANKWLKPYPHAAWRENVEVLLVAIAVAMGIRTFLVQPFKIPTGSMQPTLYGITSNPDFTRSPMLGDLRPNPDFNVPNPVVRFVKFWWQGISYTRVVAKAPGQIRSVEPPKRFLLFNLWQRFQVGDEWYTVWFPTDNLLVRAGLVNTVGQGNPRTFAAGEDIIKIKVVSGDHLFVDRFTYNFRRPKRGEIIVFETRGIGRGLPQDQFYIKRLVALGSERVRIGNDRHLVIDGTRLDAKTKHFEKVYSFDPAKPPRDSEYSGHVNDHLGREFGIHSELAPLFPNGNSEYQLKPNHYMVMGDNTVNSSDSRSWGEFSRENVIGGSFLVYWPIGRQNGRETRFGGWRKK
jgi:signal peptidase I